VIVFGGFVAVVFGGLILLEKVCNKAK
jgi:hypothetical protein